MKTKNGLRALPVILGLTVIAAAQQPGSVIVRLSADSSIEIPYEDFDQEMCEVENPICGYVFDSEHNFFFVVVGGFYPEI